MSEWVWIIYGIFGAGTALAVGTTKHLTAGTEKTVVVAGSVLVGVFWPIFFVVVMLKTWLEGIGR